MKEQSHEKILKLTRFSMLLAIEAVVCFTPLGSLPAFGPIVATLAMVPVVITAILLGPGPGAAMGAFTGLFSFIVWTFFPPNPLTAFVFTPFYSLGPVKGNFWSLAVCFVPRILAGPAAGASHALFTRLKWKNWAACSVSGALGSLTNTLLVLGGIYLFFGPSYAEALGVGYNLLLGMVGLTVLTSGVPEALIAAAVAAAVGPLQKRMKTRF